ncbi:MAG: LVIVD repeat-containing protein [Candidatus Hodarchaeales archaeon]
MNKLFIKTKINRPLKVIYFLVLVTLIFLDILAVFFLPQVGLGGLVAYSVCVEGDHAYVTGNNGVTILNVNDPSQPEVISALSTNDGAFGIAVENEAAFVASSGDGFVIANVSNPVHPTLIWKSGSGGTVELCVNDSLAYVTDSSSEIRIYNYSNPSLPFEIGFYYNRGRGSSVAVYRDILFLGEPNSGLKVINITDPTSPHDMNIVSGTRGIMDIYLHNNLIFLACHANGVKILNVSSQIPTLIGSFIKSEGEAYGVSGNNTHLYVADLQLGAYLLNITNPSQPTELASYGNAAPHDIYFEDKTIYLADQDKRLIILNQHLEPLFAGFPRDIKLQLLLIGITLVVGSILPISWYRRKKK